MKQIGNRFWLILENSPKRITTFAVWQRATASEFRLFEPMFHPVGGLARTVIDPDNIDGPRLSVVDYGNGKYGAVDEDLTRRVPLTLEDIILYTLNFRDFRYLLGQILEFNAVSDAIPPASTQPMRFGTCQIKPGVEFPVYMILAQDGYLMVNRLRILLTTERNSFFLLTATRLNWTQEIRQLVHDRKSQLVSLEECLVVDGGRFAKSETWDNAVSAFRAMHFPESLIEPPASHELRKSGQGWLLRFEGKEMVLKDSRGVLYIALLLSKPDQMIFASDLLAIAEGKDPAKVLTAGSAGTITDLEALKEVEKELRSLQADLEQARIDGDTLVEQEVLGEIEKLGEYARKATDGRGKLRKASDDSDAHRQSVFKAIDRAIEEIVKVLPNCAAHFRKQIRTGSELFYQSDEKIRWNL